MPSPARPLFAVLMALGLGVAGCSSDPSTPSAPAPPVSSAPGAGPSRTPAAPPSAVRTTSPAPTASASGATTTPVGSTGSRRTAQLRAAVLTLADLPAGYQPEPTDSEEEGGLRSPRRTPAAEGWSLSSTPRARPARWPRPSAPSPQVPTAPSSTSRWTPCPPRQQPPRS
jgi:S-DNA-T family DNA segregation ATPase FtsK/SpoIIIE